jgi:hypothetical protein
LSRRESSRSFFVALGSLIDMIFVLTSTTLFQEYLAE